jgi:hypothetical protein
MVQIDVLEKPIERIKETCAMMGIAEKFDRALPDLETFLEAEVARGETRETRLTFDGLRYLKQLLIRKETPDRSKIDIHDLAEMKWWSDELEVSREKLRSLVDKIGNSAATVRKELDREKSNVRT